MLKASHYFKSTVESTIHVFCFLSYICKRCEKPGHWVYQCSIRDSFTKPKCFLCFGSEKYDKKMVVLSDEHVYISCAKGPLINEDFIIASNFIEFFFF